MKNKFSSQQSYFITSLILFVFTFFLLIHHYYNVAQKRQIASHRNDFLPIEIFSTTSIQNNRNMKLRLLQNLKIEDNTSFIKIYLGSFILNTNGDIKNTCELYPSITIELQAEGVFYNGDPVLMQLASDCEYLAGADQLAPILINKYMDQSPNEVFLPSVKLIGVVGDIPKLWHIRKISLQSKDKRLELTSYEVNFIKGGPTLIKL